MFIGNKTGQQNVKVFAMILATIVMCGMLATTAAAQAAPYYPPDQMERMVSRVALYPDPLLAQVLAAATFPDEIPDAAAWADQHHDQNGSELAASIDADQLPWDPSVQALLPFPNVLHMMASDMRWTGDLGNAFLGQQQDVMYAVQRMRQRARDYGYLRSGPQIVVAGGPYITIMPARPDYVVVPYYDPVVVYARPRVGFFVGTAIGFRFGVALGAPFRPWGWGYNRIAWDRRVVFINNAPWQRTWVNRHEYHHPYTVHYYPEHRNFREHEVSLHGREHDASFRAHERNEIRHDEHRAVQQERHEDHRAVQAERHEDHRAVAAERHEDHRAVVAERHENHGHENKGHEEHGQKDKGDHGHGEKDDHIAKR
jgi:hypothetical protein